MNPSAARADSSAQLRQQHSGPGASQPHEAANPLPILEQRAPCSVRPSNVVVERRAAFARPPRTECCVSFRGAPRSTFYKCVARSHSEADDEIL